jgi:AraC family transcriptional activator of pobA
MLSGPPNHDATLPPLEVTSLGTKDTRRPWRVNGLFARPRHALIWTSRGQGRITLAGVQKGVGAHNAIFIPAGTMFALDMPQMFGSVVWIDPALGLNTPDHPLHLRPRDVQSHAELTSRIDALQQELSSEKPGNAAAAQAFAQLCLVWIDRNSQSGPITRPTAAERLMHRFSALIEANLHQGQTTTDFANQLNVTLTHLSRACKAQSGRTAAHLLAERLTIEAREELSKNDITVRAVSERLGFSTPGNFSRFFQRNTGESPRNFISRLTHTSL